MSVPYTPLTDADVTRLDALFERCEAFFLLVSGAPPKKDEARRLMTAGPPGIPLKNKYLFGLGDENKLIGVVDIFIGYPRDDVAFIGLFLLDPEHRGRGLGEDTYRTLEAWLLTRGLNEIHLGVQIDNIAGRRFWERMDFKYLRDAPLLESDDPTPTVHVYGKKL